MLEIGNVRPDGKRNIWAWRNVRGFFEWIIIDVVPDFKAGVARIDQELRNRRGKAHG